MTKRTLILCTAIALTSIASADWTLGSGRSAGMGRAGLALPGDYLYSGRLNPAMYGLAPSTLRFQFPRLSFRNQGLSLGDLSDYFGKIDGGGFNLNDLSNIARNLGDENFEFGVGTGLGFLTNGFALDINGDALVAGIPNQDLKNWVNTGGLGNVPVNSRLDTYGLGGYEIGVGYGRRLNTPGTMDLSIGARVKVIRSYYSHGFADASTIQSNGVGTLAPEMNGEDVLSESSLGLDLGFVASASKTEGFFVGATIENLIQPRSTFNVTSPLLTTGTVRPYSRTVNFGVGYLAPNSVRFAADFYDITNAGGAQEFRAGAELKSGSIALRGGYESRSGVTFGVGFGDFNLSFGGNSSGLLSYALRF